MHRTYLMTLCLLVAGCAGKSFKVDHPVVGPAPPRIPGAVQTAMNEEGDAAVRGQSAPIRLASSEGGQDKPLEMTDVVATVNGQPILASAILGSLDPRMRGQMEMARKSLPPAEYRKAQEFIIKQDLNRHVEQSMMYSAMRTKMKTDMMESVNEQLDKAFAETLEKMRADYEAKAKKPITMIDLEAILQSQGMSIPAMRSAFGEKMLAQEYLRAKLEGQPPVSRQDLLEAYRERQEEFTSQPQVKWQQIQISYKNYPDKETARMQADLAMSELQQGTPFADVARKYSDGPDAAKGGIWDWTRYDSLLTELQEPLRSLPSMTPSQVLTTPRSLQIVQVLERQEATVKPFAEVQKQLQNDLEEFRHKIRVQEILAELRSQSVVQTIFDGPEEAGSASPAVQ